MAGTIVQGSISTEEVLPDERVIDMDENIREVDPNQTQYTTMTTKTTSRQAVREKVNWLEHELFPNTVAAVNAQLSTDATMVLVAGQGKVVQANDFLRNMRSGEGMRVTSVATDTVGIARGVGTGPGFVAAAAINAGDVFLVVGDAQPQGSDFPTPRYMQRVLGFNYTQITRTPWGFTGTMTAIELYGGREPAKAAVDGAIVHKRKWENIGFFGARAFTAAVPPENEPQGFAGGLIEFITSVKRDCAGALTPDFFDKFAMDVFANGTQDKVLFASPAVVRAMSAWNRQGMGNYYPAPRDGKVHGVKIDSFISGAYGFEIPIIVKKEWNKYPTANKGYGGYAFLVDMSYVERRPLRDRDTKLLTEQQPRGKDSYAAEYITEATYEVAVEKAHGIIFGAT